MAMSLATLKSHISAAENGSLRAMGLILRAIADGDVQLTDGDFVTLTLNGTAVSATAAELNILDGVTATAAELNLAADVSAWTQELTASGAITAGKRMIELNHATVVIAATAAAGIFAGQLVTFKDTSASGTAAHTVTLTGATFNGTNTIATFNAPGEELVVLFDASGDGTVLANVGSVGLS